MKKTRGKAETARDIFERFRAGEPVPMNDPEYGKVGKAVNQTFKLLAKLNASTNVNDVRTVLSEIIGRPVDESTTIFPPFHTNFGRHITLGKNVFINHACSFLDLGCINIEDNVMIGPRVNITSENHPVNVAERKTLIPGAVTIKQNAWIGAGATILPGVTVGENAVVAAGALVNRDVPSNTVVGGVPARVLKKINS